MKLNQNRTTRYIISLSWKARSRAITVQLRKEGGGSGEECRAGEWQETKGGGRRNQSGIDGGRSQEQEKPDGDQEHSQDNGPWWSRGRVELWWRLDGDVADGSGALDSATPKVLEAEAEPQWHLPK